MRQGCGGRDCHRFLCFVGGMPSTDPNPTGAVGANKIITDKPVVTIPGCPPNPYNFLSTVGTSDLRRPPRSTRWVVRSLPIHA